jgi:hypothetical protein
MSDKTQEASKVTVQKTAAAVVKGTAPPKSDAKVFKPAPKPATNDLPPLVVPLDTSFN